MKSISLALVVMVLGLCGCNKYHEEFYPDGSTKSVTIISGTDIQYHKSEPRHP